jgi:hypothetical protein
MLYAGLDYPLRTSDLCILNEDGKAIKRCRVRGRRDEVAAELSRLGEPVAVVFEATGGYGPLHEHERPASAAGVRRVVMAHPAHLRLIWGTKRKNDRLDALKLAKLLYLDAVPRPAAGRAAVAAARRAAARAGAAARGGEEPGACAAARLRDPRARARVTLFGRAGVDWLGAQDLDKK